MATKTRRRTSESERDERRRADRERLQRAAEQLLSSAGWERWVRVRSRNGLARYSLNNQLLIAFARPNATFVAGFRAWLELRYQVGKGEKAIWILAPLKIKERDRASGEETGETRTLFRAVPVFDRTQVTAREHATPLEPPVEPLSGDSHEHLLEPLERFAGSLGFTVSFETIDEPAGGWCDAKRKRIVVDAHQPANARVRVLIHEIAHALGVDYRKYSRAHAEVIVDTASFVVGSSVHLDLGGETIPYVAGWGENGALEAVTEFAATIDTMARQIEQALDTDQSPASAELAPLPAM
jgi:N-terminal domain of anti-restriction factor ArdC